MMVYVDLYNLCIYCFIELRFKTRRYVYLQFDFDVRFLNYPRYIPTPINFLNRCSRCGRHLEHRFLKAQSNVIGSSTVKSLEDTYHFLHEVVPSESQNPASVESQDCLAHAV